MDFVLTQALYDWMHERRIVAAVADEIGMEKSTLSAELRPACTSAKLGVDTLIKLCHAVRQLGYGKELDGILHQYFDALKGPATAEPTEKNMQTSVIELTKTLGILADFSDRIYQITDEAELVKLNTMVRTVIFPTVMQIESIIESQLSKIRRKQIALATEY